MTIRWKKYNFTINEFYGYKEEKLHLKSADIHAYFQQSQPIKTKRKFSIHRQVLNLCIDLQKSETVLLKEMNKKNRYKINRARRDGVQFEYIEHPDYNDIKVFATFFDHFAKLKGIETCKFGKLKSLMENNMLVITAVYHPDGRKLAASATIIKSGLAIGLYSCSARFFNKDFSGQFVSRANRYLHWCELIQFKSQGCHTFDFKGLTIDKNNTEHQNINEFKRSFGGEERIEYQSFIPQNLRGLLLVLTLKFLWRNNIEIIRNEQLPLAELTESPKEQR